MKPKFVLLDFEWVCPGVDLDDTGIWAQSEHPCFEILCCVWGYRGQGPNVWLPGSDNALLAELAADPEVVFVRHSDAETAVWRNQMVPRFGFPDVLNERWADTLTVCAVKGLPLSLEDVNPVLRLPRKDTEGNALIRSLQKFDKRGYATKITGDVLQRVVEYCVNDYWAELALLERVGWLPKEHVWSHSIHQRLAQRGLKLDLEYIAACEKIVADATVPLIDEFRALTKCEMFPNGLKPTQRDKALTWIRNNGVIIADYTKDTIAALLGSDIDDAGDDSLATDTDAGASRSSLPAPVSRALRIRQLTNSSAVKKLRRMAACVGADGRARGMSQYNGAMPGRSTGRGYNPYNFPRGTLKLGDTPPPPEIVVGAILTGDHEYVEATVGPAVETVVSGLRHAIVSKDGYVFMSGDYASIQARVVLALAGQWDKVDLLASGADIYIDMAQQIFKRKIDKKKDPAERQTGKNSVLGLGFQMGAKKFWDKYCAGQPLSFSEKVVAVYRQEWAPEVPKLWRGLANASLHAVRTKQPQEISGIEYALEDIWLTARLPSGRKLWYANPRLSKQSMPWDEDDIRLCWTYQCWQQGQWKTKTAFGGSLTENVVMGIEVDIHRLGMRNVEKAFGVGCLAHECYDEVLAEVPEKDADAKCFRDALSDMPRWVHEMRIPVDVPAGDIWVGTRYRK